ncbi:DUF554 domain-containing protein [Ferviditalea candida]|uniref:DUF554 domain-containing protein n=1 Tax=Ferviditalea candida TaxID=3108399 RepID=A0ABU5ZGQ5_9BACL|nr:DUF554 domain-containing protein [Paenibacillaceae bacterium T2]
MALWGTIVNALAIIAGGILGSFIPKLAEGIRTTVMQGLGMTIVVLGVSMSFKTENILIAVVSLVVGGIIGELMKIDRMLEIVGMKLEKIVGSRLKGNIAAGFVTATLIYCVGAMAILGAIDGGLRHNHDILYTKAALDGFTAVIFASTLGIGVMFSAIPVFLYQGLIALSATWITHFLSDGLLNGVIREVTAVGGILIVGIGLNILEIKKINVANLLPSLIIAAIAVLVLSLV